MILLLLGKCCLGIGGCKKKIWNSMFKTHSNTLVNKCPAPRKTFLFFDRFRHMQMIGRV